MASPIIDLPTSNFYKFLTFLGLVSVLYSLIIPFQRQEVLLKEMSDGPGDIAIIVAGYPKEMNHFLTSNPGLKSRFNLFYNFQDYLPLLLYRLVARLFLPFFPNTLPLYHNSGGNN